MNADGLAVGVAGDVVTVSSPVETARFRFSAALWAALSAHWRATSATPLPLP